MKLKKIKQNVLSVFLVFTMLFQNIFVNTIFANTIQTLEENQNLLVNGDFGLTTTNSKGLWLNGLEPTNWKAAPFGSYKPIEYSLDSTTGTNIVKMNVTETNSRGIITSDKIEVKPLVNYELKGKFLLESVAGNNFGIQLKQYKADGTTKAANEKILFAKNGSNDWSDLSGQFYTTSETKYIEIIIIAGATSFLTGGTMQVKNLSLKKLEVPVKKIEIESEIYNTINTEQILIAKLTPSNASNKTIVWSSDNESIATVDQNGKVSLVSLGTTQIKATTEDGSKEAICNITVVDKINIEEINLQTDIKLELGDSIRLVPSISPKGIKAKDLTWESSDTTIAFVSKENDKENGIVTANKLGEVTITATTPQNYGGKFAQSKITVVPKSENLIPNGGFEEISSSSLVLPKGYKTWTPTGFAEQNIDNTYSYRGNNSYKFKAEENTRTSLGLIEPINISAGTYKLSTLVKAENIVLTNGVRMRYTITKNDASKISNYSQGKKASTDDWEEEYIIFTAPDDAKNVGIEIFFETGTGTAWVDNLKLEKWIPITDLLLPQQETLDLQTQPEKILNFTTTPQNATEGNLIWNTSNEKVVSVNNSGKIKGNMAGEAIITVMTIDGNIKSNCKVIVTGTSTPKPITNLEINKTELELKVGRTEELTLTVSPNDATENIIWTSSNENVATVINGRVTSKAVGTTTIKAKSDNGIEITCNVTVKEYVSDEFDTLRISWKNRYNTEKNINESVTQTQNLWDKMYKNDETKFLWEDVVNYKAGGNITTTARRLKTMAIASSMESSSFYNNQQLINDIVKGTMWLYENTYSEANLKYYDWFSWDIGIPQAMNDILALLYENFTDDEISKITNFIGDKIMPDPKYSRYAVGAGETEIATGANLLDQTKSALMPAILRKQSDKISLFKERVLSTLDYVTSEDGFYEDGSFVQHTCVPYTGSYGIVWLGGMADITEILSGTKYQLETAQLCNLIENSFIDFIYNGSMMDMVRGRAIAKANNDDHDGGHSAINSITRISNSMQNEDKNKFLSLAKYWIQNDTCDDNIKQFYNELINDENIVAKKPDDKGKEYYNMNRSMYHRNDFAFGISKSSKKIQTFELTNGENQKGWYTGDGMTYLYNDDVNQFNDLFWVTVDYYKLPGTTVDTMTRTFGDYQNGDGEGRPNNSWAGGTTNGIYGASGMNLQSIKSDLNLNKSWFVFDDEIVAVGSNINSQSGRDIETIIEQRKIDGNNSFIVNGEQKSTQLGWSETMTDVKWAYLQGNGITSPIGYYFPNGETLEATREARSGDYDSINQGKDKTQYTEKFLTIWKNHGVNPQGDIYAYSILPNKTPQEIEEYSKNPDIKIIAQTKNVHAVREKNLGILAANFFSNSETTVEYLTSYNNSSIMIKEDNGYLDINVSDPTSSNQNTIELELKDYQFEVVEIPSNIKVSNLETGLKISIDVSGNNKGQTFNMKLKINSTEISKVNNPEIQRVIIGTPLEELIFPNNVTVALVTGKTVEIPVSWSQDDESKKYNGEIEGEYIFKGTLGKVSGISNPNQYTSSIKVIVIPKYNENLEKSILSAKAVLNNPNSTADAVVKAMLDLSKAMAIYSENIK